MPEQTRTYYRPFMSICLVLAAALVVAMAPLPYWCYQYLRSFVFIAGSFAAFAGNNRCIKIFGAGVTVTFNPLWPMPFNKELWHVIDFATAGGFLAIGFFLRTPVGPKADDLDILIAGNLDG